MKKTIIKPFDVEKAKNGAKVVTRDGRNVRIICYDRDDPEFTIIGLVRIDNDIEACGSFTKEGRYRHSKNGNDLFIEEEVEEQNYKFKPFDKVLVRYLDSERWKCDIFSHIEGEYYFCVGGFYNQCIPYKGNEHLVGTTNSP
ncbi:MAG: hypothetical protein Q4A15_11480, partial [Prevotellaceae bacterium]|nr:hypothetical protein [Prevotellaceae bacterium]